MKLRPIEERDLESLKEWRNADFEHLRTPFKLNSLMQCKWFKDIVSSRDSKFRFYAIDIQENGEADKLIGYGALEISWENRYAELGILIGTKWQRKGLGVKVVKELINTAFKWMNLDSVHIECYKNSPALLFWYKLAARWGCKLVEIPLRKYANGEYWDSIYFVITRDIFKKITTDK